MLKKKTFPVRAARFNDQAALFLQHTVGNMYCAYIFMGYGLLGLFFPEYLGWLNFWSSWPQLWLLPVILVATNLLGRANERREVRMFTLIREENIAIKKQMHLLELLSIRLLGEQAEGKP